MAKLVKYNDVCVAEALRKCDGKLNSKLNVKK